MRIFSKLIWPFIFAVAFIALSRIFILGATVPAQTINLSDDQGSYIVDDDNDVPDVTARVARISFMSGNAQIRHADGGEWENAVLNLPVVEGDEITTESNSRVEIQFDNFQHLRIDENAYLKIANLKYEGIAISLSLGTMSVTITQFDQAKAYFEVDAPKTTLAILKAGIYRIDAGQQNDNDIRVSVNRDGEARIYSDSSGFTLKNGRSARIFIDGPNAGEWQSDDAAQFSDDFDTWTLDRDAVIAQRLKDAYYDQYYDNDLYGADDLNGFGDWVHTAQYGYIWRPYASVTNAYSNWSPYRYGHWRWMPPYGWTWINDEPWGWATYHYGRWFYDSGSWYWSPYGYYRYSRSWWSPALVVLNIYGGGIAWYPLPYTYGYYNYNYYYNHHHGWGGHHGGHHHGGSYQPPTVPTGGVKVPKIPPSAVVATTVGEFGTTTKPPKTAPLSVANTLITTKVEALGDPVLPAYSATTKKMSSEIKAVKPRTDLVAAQTKVGAAPRKTDSPLDKELRTTRVFGGREPLTKTDDAGGVKTSNTGASEGSEPRKTGAVTRPPTVKQVDSTPTVKQAETTPPIRQAPVKTQPTKTQDDSSSPPVRTPVYVAPPKQESPRYDPPVRQTPRSEPAPAKQSPTKSEPKQESKPAPSKSASSSSKSKDG